MWLHELFHAGSFGRSGVFRAAAARRRRHPRRAVESRSLVLQPLEDRCLLTLLTQFNLSYSDALDLEQDASTLYWVDQGGSNASDLHIRRINKNGSGLTTMQNIPVAFNSNTGNNVYPVFSGFDIDNTDVYYRVNALSGTGIFKKPKIGDSNTPVTQIGGWQLWEFGNMAFDPLGSTLFVTDFSHNEVFAVNKFNGTKQWTLTGRSGADAPVTADSTNVYWVELSHNRLMQASHVGGAVSQVIYELGGTIVNMAADVDGNLFWLTGDGSVVRNVPGGNPVIVAIGAEGDALAVDAYQGNVYYAKDATIHYKAKTASTLQPDTQLVPYDLAHPLYTIADQLVVDPSGTGYVYWVSDAGLNEISVHRYPKPSTPDPPNQGPTDIALTATTVAENQPPGTVVGTFTTTDPNPGNTFTYSLVAGAGSADNASFAITGNQLKTNAAFDYETKSNYQVRVRSTDQGNLSFEKSFPIRIGDLSETPDKLGFHRGSLFAEDLNGNGIWDGSAGGDALYQFGQAGDTPLIGDWNGDGSDEIGFHRDNLFGLDANGNGIWDGAAGGDRLYSFGLPGDTPIVGDWDGNGADEIGYHRSNYFALDFNGNGIWQGSAGGDRLYRFGLNSDTPLIGDWNGDGRDEIGLHRNQYFALDANGNGIWQGSAGGDAIYSFGQSGDTPIAGDWNDDGTDEIGLHRANFFGLDVNGNGRWEGGAGGDAVYALGEPGDTPLIGYWSGAGSDDWSNEIGLHRSASFGLDRNGNGVWQGSAGGDVLHSFGRDGDQPLIGDWNGARADQVGFHRDNYFALDANGDGIWQGSAGGDALYRFGVPGDLPLIGDWDGDGIDNIGFHRSNYFALDANGNGVWQGSAGGDALYRFGQPGDTPLIGDWDGDGVDNIGFHRSNYFALDANGDGIWQAAAGGDALYRFGQPGDTPLIGDWDGDGVDNIGFHRSNYFALDANGDGIWQGSAGGDALYRFGLPGDTPLVGNWALAPGLTAAPSVAHTLSDANVLTADDLAAILPHAIDTWTAVGLSSRQQDTLARLDVRIADLPGARLGQAVGSTVLLDINAAGYGWFVDPTPGLDEEFTLVAGNEYRTNRQSAIANRQSFDLLTAVMHEIGHVLGYDHEATGVMQEELSAGTRPAWGDTIDNLFAPRS